MTGSSNERLEYHSTPDEGFPKIYESRSGDVLLAIGKGTVAEYPTIAGISIKGGCVGLFSTTWNAGVFKEVK